MSQIKNASSIGGRRRKHGATRSKVLAHVLKLGKWKCFPDINQGVGKRGPGGARGLLVEESLFFLTGFFPDGFPTTFSQWVLGCQKNRVKRLKPHNVGVSCF